VLFVARGRRAGTGSSADRRARRRSASPQPSARPPATRNPNTARSRLLEVSRQSGWRLS